MKDLLLQSYERVAQIEGDMESPLHRHPQSRARQEAAGKLGECFDADETVSCSWVGVLPESPLPEATSLINDCSSKRLA